MKIKILVLLLLALAVGCVGTVSSAKQQSEIFRGSTKIEYSDDFDRGTSKTKFFLTDEDGREFRLRPAPGRSIPLANDVVVKGRQTGSIIDVESISVESIGIQTINNGKPSLGPQRRLVMLFNFQDNPTNKPWPAETVRDLFFNQVNQFYQEASYGRTTLTGELAGWFTIPLNSTDCTSPMTNLADDGARALGFDPSSYTDKVYIFPTGGCHSYGGVAAISTDSNGSVRSTVYITGYGNNFYSLAHEYGHTLGFSHSNSLGCPAGVSLADNCTFRGYGDNYDVMGNWNTFYPGAAHRSWGWWLDEGTTQQTVTSDGTFTLTPVESASVGLKVIRIPKTYTYSACDGAGVCTPITLSGYYYLEYRQPIGRDSSLPVAITGGVLFHLLAPRPPTDFYPEYFEESSGSLLIDAEPANSNIALGVGRTYADANLPLTVTALSADAAGVTLSIQFSYNPPPPPPPDTTAPTISITAPADGDRISKNGQVNVYVDARDDVAVTRVVLYVDGALIINSTTAPFTTKWNARRAASGSHTLYTKAYDAAGNVGTSQQITIYK